MLHLQQGQSNGFDKGDDSPIDYKSGDIRGSSNISNNNNNTILDTIPSPETIKESKFTKASMIIDDVNGTIRNNCTRDDNTSNVTETIESPQSFPDSVEQMMDAFVAIKEKAYGFIRRILSDLVTIIKRSATKARDWAVEDDTGQLVSSSLALVGFFALVAAFAAWNIEVLSGGKSKWLGPQNGVTVPVLKGLPAATEAPVAVVKIQKPKWKTPKIQTSYTTSDSVSNLLEKNDELLDNEVSARRR